MIMMFGRRWMVCKLAVIAVPLRFGGPGGGCKGLGGLGGRSSMASGSRESDFPHIKKKH